MNTEEELLRGIRAGLVGWYDFTPDSRVLCMGAHKDAVAGYLRDVGLLVECADIADVLCESWLRGKDCAYDYVISVGDLERTEVPKELLVAWKNVLKPDGRLLFAVNNRLGLRYFCGDRDPYTRHNFDGIENYRRIYGEKDADFVGRMYARDEIGSMLKESGWSRFRVYSVLSDLDNPAFIFAEDFLPNEDMVNRLFPTYNSPDTVFMEEEYLYSSLIDNGLFHAMANAYLVECVPSGEFSDVLHVTVSMERGRDNALFTVIRNSGTVEKRAAFIQGGKRLMQLAENIAALKAHGIPVVEGQLQGNSFVMPHVCNKVGQLYLKELFYLNQEKFLCEMDNLRDMILQSSEIISPDKGDGEGAMLSRGYWDMVPLNSFFVDGKPLFFDQEFYMEPCPANYVIYRMVATFYQPAFKAIMPIEKLLARYGLDKCLKKWQRMEEENIIALRKETELRAYHEKCRRNLNVVNSNRLRMNYSAGKYLKVFVDIFQNIGARKLILFGSGKFAKRFMSLYKADYPVYKIVDNNPDRWGDTMDGVDIVSPDILKGLDNEGYKVIICIKNYEPIVDQLESMRVSEYSVYDANREYHRKFKPLVQVVQCSDEKPKKYHVGYIAGVFDLFHIGHLNMFKRAKEQCDYLIVGVVSDEGVRKFKMTEPFIPCSERIEMIKSCRYVDEVYELPLYHADTRDVWEIYHFDVQFSGSDYEHDEVWLKKQKFLRERGSDMVFFPYTEQTSSTKIKALIKEKLL